VFTHFACDFFTLINTNMER